MRSKLSVGCTSLVCLALVAGCGGSSKPKAATTSSGSAASGSGMRLNGNVGPGFTITLEQNGKPVTSLKAVTYTFVVTDQATIHGFTLEQESGGSFEQALTSVPSEGTQSVTVKLTKGEWKYYCPPHESQMHGSFTVT